MGGKCRPENMHLRTALVVSTWSLCIPDESATVDEGLSCRDVVRHVVEILHDDVFRVWFDCLDRFKGFFHALQPQFCRFVINTVRSMSTD